MLLATPKEFAVPKTLDLSCLQDLSPAADQGHKEAVLPEADKSSSTSPYRKPLAGITICLIDEKPFVRECIRIAMTTYSDSIVSSFASAAEFRQNFQGEEPEIGVVTCFDSSDGFLTETLDELAASHAAMPVIVFGPPRSDVLNVAITRGAKGYVAFTSKFEVVVEVIRVILAGGTYVPMDCLPPTVRGPDDELSDSVGKNYAALTARELSVVRAIQQGKSNKAIAYSLNMTESTVKAHVRNVMAKLNAKNRTEVAMVSEKKWPPMLDTSGDAKS